MSNKITDYTMEDLADRLLLTVCNYESCAEALGNFPHLRKGGLALYVQVATPGSKNAEGMYTSWLTVTNDRLSAWGISKKDLFEIAASSSEKLNPGQFVKLEEFVDLSDGLFVGNELPSAYIITNKFNYNGAASIFYSEGILRDLCEEMDTDKLTLFPYDGNLFFVLSNDSYDFYTRTEFQKMIFEYLDENDRLFPQWLEYNAEIGNIADLTDNTTFFPNVTDEIYYKNHR